MKTSFLTTLSIGIFFLLLITACQNRSIAPPSYSRMVATNFIERFPDPDVIHWKGQQNHFSWQAGYIMFAMEKLWQQTNDSVYYNYIRRYVDQQVDAEGNVPDFNPRALDNFLPGYAILFMYEQTGEERYARAAETVCKGFDNYPRTAEGMFIHSLSIPQVWVDGVFMGQIFLARYARTMNRPEYFEEVARQLTGVLKLCGKDNGLLYHGWAEPDKVRWETPDGQGHSPEVWSEGFGWTAVLFADIFDYLPTDLPERSMLMEGLQRMCNGLKSTQDATTGMWCQVVDKPTEPGNWNETSGTGMFIYLLQTAVNKGYIPADEYQPVIDRAYHSIITKAVRNSEGFIDLIDCSSIGIKRSYQAYISQPHEVSPFASFGSFIIGTGIVEHTSHR